MNANSYWTQSNKPDLARPHLLLSFRFFVPLILAGWFNFLRICRNCRGPDVKSDRATCSSFSHGVEICMNCQGPTEPVPLTWMARLSPGSLGVQGASPALVPFCYTIGSWLLCILIAFMYALVHKIDQEAGNVAAFVSMFYGWFLL
eukprot:s13_g42.t1